MIWTYPPNSLQWFCLWRVLHPALLNAAFCVLVPLASLTETMQTNRERAMRQTSRATNPPIVFRASPLQFPCVPMFLQQFLMFDQSVTIYSPKCHHIFPYIPIYSHVFPCIPIYSHLFPTIVSPCGFTIGSVQSPLDASCSTSSSPDRTARLSVARSDSPVGSRATRCLSLDNSPRRPCKGWESNGKLGKTEGKHETNMKET